VILIEIKEKIRKANESKKLVFGFSSVRKKLMGKKLAEVILASNCPDDTKKRIVSYCEELGISVYMLDSDSIELGILCRKNFKICVVGIEK